jgi:hypothetical protein
MFLRGLLAGGQVHGRIVDASAGPIEKAQVRLLDRESRVTKYRLISDGFGRFRLDGVKPGTYLVAATARAFRERFVDNIVVEDGRDVGLGDLILQLAGCEYPGVICDSFGTEAKAILYKSGDLKVRFESCVLDVDGQAGCSVHIHLGSDRRVYLEPRNHARLAEANSAGASCRGAVFVNPRTRVDGLGPGSDVCLLSGRGRRAELFFTSEVSAESREITMHCVIWK